jgi:hypothetical protein
VLAQVRVARSLERAASDLKRPQSAIAEFPIRDSEGVTLSV